MHEKYMQRAIELANDAKNKGNFPFGAVVVKSDEIVAEGQCEELTEHDVTKHAELTAVSKACKKLQTMDLSDCILYASGEPCNMCASAAFQADIATIVIGATRTDLAHFFRKREVGIKELARDSSHKIELISGILNNQAVGLFDGVIK